ncbi:MAG: hypothetical protein Q8N31_15540 [Reyranella sp.]|nr:hypothetical protein [Reyranella sp.]MDP3161430.1 hypothetical protein [Reyranella sp.]
MSSQSKLNRVAVVALALVLLLPLGGGTFAQPSPPPGQKAPATAPAAGAAKSDDSDVIEIIETIKQEQKKLPVTKGPPSKEKALLDETMWRAQLLEMTRKQQRDAEQQAKAAKNSAEAQMWQKEARLKADTAEGLKQSIVGTPQPPPRPAQTGQAAQAPPPASRSIEFNSGTFQQLKEANRQSTNDANQRDPGQLKSRATTEFGSGRAGAGGVALHKTATMQTPLDRARIKGAAVEDGRLVLIYGDQKIKFPVLEPQFLALAIRCVYGGEGMVAGTIVAVTPTALVLSTGKDLYGEVVWKKELLPSVSPTLKAGDKVELEFGPGVGALSMPEPSTNRITYYGPLKGNLLGKAVFESDMVFSMFWYGIHWKTGRPIDPAATPGFVSAIDVELKTPKPAAAKPAAAKKPPLAPAKNWWEDSGWFVWNPAEMVLQLSPKSGEFEFAKATMRATAWGWRDGVMRDNSVVEAKYLTDHYDELTRAFPALEQLREAAKAVAAVRWLKQNKVPLDLEWAKTYKLAAVETPELVPRFSVYVNRDDDGRPIVEKKEASR